MFTSFILVLVGGRLSVARLPNSSSHRLGNAKIYYKINIKFYLIKGVLKRLMTTVRSG